MRIVQTSLKGCALIEIEPNRDERGMFARLFCSNEFREAGLPTDFLQESVSRNLKRGTTRGLHFQRPPSNEGKLVRCTQGRILDVVVDIRSSSETFLSCVDIELSAENCRAIYIPPGFAHGFQTLENNCDVSYAMTDHFQPNLGAGLRWNDPRLAIDWPIEDIVMNDRDREYKDIDELWLGSLQWECADG